MKTLSVQIPSISKTSYDIQIGSGFLGTLWRQIEEAFPQKRLFIVTDTDLVKSNWLQVLVQGQNVPCYTIDPPGEQSKHIQTVVAIIEAMEKAFYGRDSVVIALGGGTVGDIAGFVAAIYKRGIPVVQIPTTTVAQADSSVGGKTGVDSSISKNAFGAFWQPAHVCIDVNTLNTLEDRQYRAGLVESVKHALIADASYFEYIEQHMDALLAKDPVVLEHIAYENCRIKAAIVAEDPTEQNKRRICNYGHTIGHAVESASGYELLHGECVAIGIIAAGLIEQKLGLTAPAQLRRVRRVLQQLGAPLTIPRSQTRQQLIDIIQRDKKAVGRWPRMALIEKIGTAYCKNGQWGHDVPRELVEQTVDEMF